MGELWLFWMASCIEITKLWYCWTLYYCCCHKTLSIMKCTDLSSSLFDHCVSETIMPLVYSELVTIYCLMVSALSGPWELFHASFRTLSYRGYQPLNWKWPCDFQISWSKFSIVFWQNTVLLEHSASKLMLASFDYLILNYMWHLFKCISDLNCDQIKNTSFRELSFWLTVIKSYIDCVVL